MNRNTRCWKYFCTFSSSHKTYISSFILTILTNKISVIWGERSCMSCANIAQNSKICNVPGKYFVSFFSFYVVWSVGCLDSVIIGSTLKIKHLRLAILLGDRQTRLWFIQVFKYFFSFQALADCSAKSRTYQLSLFPACLMLQISYFDKQQIF